jgi:hypothetical protein
VTAREHGILFQDEMVRALRRPIGDPLRKSVTRRTSDQWAKRRVGDRLWVRECHAMLWHSEGPPDGVDVGFVPDDYRVEYRADGDPKRLPGHWPAEQRNDPDCPRWRPSISRLTLEVVSVTREAAMIGGGLGQMAVMLPSVDDAEARLEGVADRAAYLALWRAINGDTVPDHLWRIAFRVVS